MVTILKYSLTLLLFFIFLPFPKKASSAYPIPPQDQIFTHAVEAHNRVETRANHKLLSLFCKSLNLLGKESLCSQPEATGMKKFL